MLCLLIYLFLVRLHFVFFHPLVSHFSLYSLSYKDIENNLLFKHFRKNKKCKHIFDLADLKVKAESVEPSGIDAQPLCLRFTR